jgi:hypothetical protein
MGCYCRVSENSFAALRQGGFEDPIDADGAPDDIAGIFHSGAENNLHGVHPQDSQALLKTLQRTTNNYQRTQFNLLRR